MCNCPIYQFDATMKWFAGQCNAWCPDWVCCECIDWTLRYSLWPTWAWLSTQKALESVSPPYWRWVFLFVFSVLFSVSQNANHLFYSFFCHHDDNCHTHTHTRVHNFNFDDRLEIRFVPFVWFANFDWNRKWILVRNREWLVVGAQLWCCTEILYPTNGLPKGYALVNIVEIRYVSAITQTHYTYYVAKDRATNEWRCRRQSAAAVAAVAGCEVNR